MATPPRKFVSLAGPLQPRNSAHTLVTTNAPLRSLSRIGVFVTLSLFPSLTSAQSIYETPYEFTTIAGGNVAGRVDGPPSQARFNTPGSVAAYTSDIVYVADTNNHTIRKITVGVGVTTLAGEPGVSGFRNGTGGAARFSTPNGVAVDPNGIVYVADTNNHVVRKITPDGTVTTLAGIVGGSGGLDGPATVARFFSPWGLAVDGAANVYVADSANHSIRKITPDGVVSTLAGGLHPTLFGSNDGFGAAARFGSPRGVATRTDTGFLLVADRDNNLLRLVDLSAAGTPVVTLAGVADRTTGSVDGRPARFNSPYGIAFEGVAVFVADSSNSTIRRITPALTTTVAGVPRSTGTADGVGSAARFNFPLGITVATDGTLFVADTNNHSIRQGKRALPPTLSPIRVYLHVPPPELPRLQSDPSSFSPGDRVEIICTIDANGGSYSYEWQKDGMKVGSGLGPNGSEPNGADGTGYNPVLPTGMKLLTFREINVSHAGNYTMVATNAAGSVRSNAVTINVVSPLSARLANLSILTGVATAGDSFTMGYVVGGAGTSGPKPILVRAVGPTLGATPFNIPGTLADPKLELFAGATKTTENDNWGGSPALSTAFSSVGAFAYASGTSLDAAVFTNVSSGDNSVRVSATGSGTGTVIAELYDSTPVENVTASTPRLVNVSVLKHLGTGVTAGFVIDGNTSKKVLIRAVGPTLGAAPFNVAGVVIDPQLTLFSGSTEIGTNDNWGGTAELTAAFTQVGAFALPATSRDAALLATLQPGNYTVQVSGVNNTTGTALVEIYEVP